MFDPQPKAQAYRGFRTENAGRQNSDAGAFWILFLDSNGVIGETKFSANNGISGLSINHHLGTGIAALGDLDSNGVEDLLIEIPSQDPFVILGSNRYRLLQKLFV